MERKHQFIPSAFDRLEDRVVLSTYRGSSVVVSGLHPRQNVLNRHQTAVAAEVNQAFTSFQNDYDQARATYFASIVNQPSASTATTNAFTLYTTQRVSLLAQQLISSFLQYKPGTAQQHGQPSTLQALINHRIIGINGGPHRRLAGEFAADDHPTGRDVGTDRHALLAEPGQCHRGGPGRHPQRRGHPQKWGLRQHVRDLPDSEAIDNPPQHGGIFSSGTIPHSRVSPRTRLDIVGASLCADGAIPAMDFFWRSVKRVRETRRSQGSGSRRTLAAWVQQLERRELLTLTPIPASVNLTAGVLPSTPVAVGSFLDSDTTATISNFTASINWGDGHTTAGTILPTPTAGRFDIDGTNLCTPNTYPVAITVIDFQAGIRRRSTAPPSWPIRP